jgi:hypothetical protein
VRSKEVFTSGKGSIFMRDFLKPWGNLEVVVECVVAPIEIILNGLMTHAHINGPNHILMFFNLSPPLIHFIDMAVSYYKVSIEDR